MPLVLGVRESNGGSTHRKPAAVSTMPSEVAMQDGLEGAVGDAERHELRCEQFFSSTYTWSAIACRCCALVESCSADSALIRIDGGMFSSPVSPAAGRAPLWRIARRAARLRDLGLVKVDDVSSEERAAASAVKAPRVKGGGICWPGP